MKKIICLVTLLSFAYSAFAQNANEGPKKGDLMVSINFGIGSYIGASTQEPNLSDYTLSAPMAGWFDKQPMLDIEGRWFVSDKMALKLTGGLNYSYNPAYSEVTGTGVELGDIPTYQAVPNSSNLQFCIGVGFDRYMKTAVDNLHLRIGGEFGYAYGMIRVKGDNENYMGANIGQAYALKVAPVAGADYFVNRAIFVGFDIRPIAYQYSVYSERPQEGLGLLSSDNHTFSLLSQPSIKLGIRF